MPQQPESSTSKSTPSDFKSWLSPAMPSTDFWWQCPCTTTLRASLLGCHCVWLTRKSPNMNVCALNRRASSLDGNRFSNSSLNTETHAGSNPTMGMPPRISGSRCVMICCSCCFALSSMPKSYSGRPQHSARDGSTTSQPASSSTSTAAIAVSG